MLTIGSKQQVNKSSTLTHHRARSGSHRDIDLPHTANTSFVERRTIRLARPLHRRMDGCENQLNVSVKRTVLASVL